MKSQAQSSNRFVATVKEGDEYHPQSKSRRLKVFRAIAAAGKVGATIDQIKAKVRTSEAKVEADIYKLMSVARVAKKAARKPTH